MENKTTSSTWLIIFGLLLSVLVFFGVDYWFNKQEIRKKTRSLHMLAQEMDQMESTMQELDLVMNDQEMSLEMKDRLLEEKNVQLTFLKNKVLELEKGKNASQAKIDQLNQQLAVAQAKLDEAYSQLAKQKEKAFQLAEGVIYRVQIGVLDTDSLENLPFSQNDFFIEEEEGVKKYVLGSFTDYASSIKFRDLMRKLGVEDAWVVPYQKGERLTGIEAATALNNP